MKENSPICARLAEIVSAVDSGGRTGARCAKAASDLPITMMKMVAISGSGAVTTTIGSNSMPTETKNSTAKASRSGSVSWRRAG